MPVSGLIFSINRDGERFDGVHVKVCHLAQVLRLVHFSAADFLNTPLVEAIEQIHQHDNQQTNEDERDALVVQRRVKERRRRRASDLSNRSPDQALTRKRQARFPGIESNEG